MESETMKLFAVAAVIIFGTAMPAYSIGRIGSHAADAISRNPEAGAKIQTATILSLAFAEAVAIYALVVALILKFV
jgi:F-type H+-transporting ATPase subunit c